MFSHVWLFFDDSFHGLGERSTGVVEYGLEVLQSAVGLCLNILADQLAGGRVERDLARSIDKLAIAYGLTIRTNSGWSLVGANLCTLHSYISLCENRYFVITTIMANVVRD